MTILAIETSTHVCSAALAHNGSIVAARIDRETGNHAKQLPVFIDELLQIARQQQLQIEAVALSEGPGSYTGLRIGTATAKGLCYGFNIPLIPIPTTEVLCAGAKKHFSSFTYHLSPLIDARRMEVYTALYDADIKPLTPIQAVVVESRESLISNSDSGLTSNSEAVYYFGDGAAKCREILESDTWHFLPDFIPDAANMFDLAEQYLVKGKACKTAVELAYYEPFYLKEFVAAKSHIKGLT